MREELQGLVFDIQGYSVHDGPGCRTQVFMKGCPLNCEWCSNPEGMHATREVIFRNSRCVNRQNSCSRCIEACPHQAIVQNPAQDQTAQQLLIDRLKCRQCANQECLELCYFEGLKSCGQWWTVDDLMQILERNRRYWGTRGGASFSGGEPLLQHEFMGSLFEACREAHTHITVETTAHIQQVIFSRLMDMVDFAFIDLKHMDPHNHRLKTGGSNELILHNIESLAGSHWPGRLVLRMAVINGFNDLDENIEAMAEFMQLQGLSEINILPFHRLGETKWTQLGRVYPYQQHAATPDDKMVHIQDIFLGKRIACYVGSNTPY
jgi:pyruvate formate lyase activating enzyme